MAQQSKILITGYNESYNATLGQTLNEAGFQVDVAVRKRDLVAVVRQERPDLLVCDISDSLPDGLSAVRALRREPGFADLPLILCSYGASEEDRAVGLEIGADDYVTIPCSAQEFTARVRAVLRRSRS
jgi:DNA-binding response OmpR family regulator